MDSNYTKVLTIVEDALSRINNLYKKAPCETFEDIKGCKATEKLLEDLNDFARTIERYSKDTEEGYLVLNRNGRYELNGTELTCGYPVELYNQESGGYNDGRIEYSDAKFGGYYFYNYDEQHFALSENMRARIRK